MDYKKELIELQKYCIDSQNYLKASESSSDRTAAGVYNEIRNRIDEIFEAAGNPEPPQQPLPNGNDSDYIPQKGDLFEWCDEMYWCIGGSNYSGTVNPVGETFYQRGFIWNYGGEKPKFIRKATEQEFENMFGNNNP